MSGAHSGHPPINAIEAGQSNVDGRRDAWHIGADVKWNGKGMGKA